MEIPRLMQGTEMDSQSPNGPKLTAQQRERETFIIEATETLLANFSRDSLTFGKLALAMRLTPAMVRPFFPDVDCIHAEILIRHLGNISSAIDKIPHDDPNRRVQQRAAYLKATRTAQGEITEPHLVLIRERHTLPDAHLKPIEDARLAIGDILAGENAAAALALLDAPELRAPQIEAMLAAITRAPAAPEAPGGPQARPPYAGPLPRSR